MWVVRESLLSRARTLALLDEFGGDSDAARTFYMPAGLATPEVTCLLEERLEVQSVPPQVPSLIVSSRTGGMLFWSPTRARLLLPPFPIEAESFSGRYSVEPLRSQLRRDYRIALILVRLGAYAVGVCVGERLVSSKVGTGLVHGRQRHGGSSAQRYTLRRRGQIGSFVERVCGHIQEHVDPRQPPDYVAYGGSKAAILLLKKECRLLDRFEDRALPPLLDIGEPRQPVLEAAIGRVWSSRVFTFEYIA